MQTVTSFLTQPSAMGIIAKLEKSFAGLPHLPKGVVNFLVIIVPWLALLGGIFGVLGGLSSVFSTNRFGFTAEVMKLVGINPTYFVMTGLIQIVSGALLLMAFTHLKQRHLTGWIYLFWNTALSIVQVGVGIIFLGMGSVVGLIVGLAIGYYLLFEVKSQYHQ